MVAALEKVNHSDEIDDLLPPHLVTASRRLVCEAEVLKIYSKLRGYSAQECMITLLEYMSAWEDYGVTHFIGKVSTTNLF